MIIAHYESKKTLKENIGNPLMYTETSMFGNEFKPNGSFCVSNRPSISGYGTREFFAEVTMENGVIVKVS